MRSLPASIIVPASTGPAAPPAALVEAARALQPLAPCERRGLLRDEAGLLLDGLLTRVARSRSALDVALCEGLGALSSGDRLLRLGFSGVGDYARERLGVAARTGQVMARLGRALAERPRLRAAVRAGEVSVRAAEELVAVAVGADEARWVERARRLTVRALVAAVREARAGAQVGEPEAAEPTGGERGAPTCAARDLERAQATGGAAQACAAEAGDPLGVRGTQPAAPRDSELATGAAARACAFPAGAPDRDAPDPDTPGGEPWQPIALEVTPSARDALLRALDLAGQLLGEGAPRWQRLEAVAQEYLGAHGGGGAGDDEADEAADDELVAATLAAWRGESPLDRAGGATGDGAADAISHRPPGWRAELEAALEVESSRWAILAAVPSVAAPTPDLDLHPARLDEALREVAALRQRWDSLLGHLALLLRMLGLWRDLQFGSFAHYCRERLGLGVRQVERRIALERRLYALPSLRAALEAGRLDGERARLVARVATEGTEAGWIARAAEVPAVTLQREVEAVEGSPPAPWAVAARLCAPEEPLVELRLRAPVRVATLLAEALLAAQRAPSPDGQLRWRTPSECLARVADHFLEAWRDQPRARSTPQRRALRRDGHRCQVPGCSRAAVHAHHVLYRSRGGGDQEANLVSLCAAHHLHGVHRGFVRVHGVAPHGLRWALGERGGSG